MLYGGIWTQQSLDTDLNWKFWYIWIIVSSANSEIHITLSWTQQLVLRGDFHTKTNLKHICSKPNGLSY